MSQQQEQRQHAIATLKRAASNREPPAQASPPPLAFTRGRPRALTASAHRHPPAQDDDDTSLFHNTPGESPLERKASLLARQLAMAKLTGTAPPTPPPTFFAIDEPLPTLEDLQRRARAKLEKETGVGLRRNNTTAVAPASRVGPSSVSQMAPPLKRNNTVVGTGVSNGLTAGTTTEVMETIRLAQSRLPLQPQPPPPDAEHTQSDERSEARVNLMRKLSARRLASPANPGSAHRTNDRLEVVGRIGRARPRSGSVGGMQWELADAPIATDQNPIGNVKAAASALPTQTGGMFGAGARAARQETTGMGIEMNSSVTTYSSQAATALPGSFDAGPDSIEVSTDESERSEEDRNVWQVEPDLQTPVLITPADRLRPDSEVEQIRDSREHFPMTIQTTSMQSSPHPSFRSFASNYSSERTPQASWAPAFFGESSTAAQLASPSSATTIQEARFANPPPSYLVDEAISPNSSPSYPNPDWPTYANGQHRRSMHSSARETSDAQLEPTTALSSVSISPSASQSSISSTSSVPSFELRAHQHSNGRTQRPIPTFGIAAVETPSSGFFGAGVGAGHDRKRGSSASSSLAMLEASRRMRERGSDATQLHLGSINMSDFERNRLGSVVSSIGSTGSGSPSGTSLDKTVSRPDEDEMENLHDSGAEDRRPLSGHRMNSNLSPPEEGYQFPSTSKDDMPAQSKPLSGRPNPESEVASETSARLRKPLGFTFNLPFQPSPFHLAPTDSKTLPDPISPRAVVPDPFSHLSFPALATAEIGDERVNEASSASPSSAERSPPAARSIVKSPSAESEASSFGGNSSYHSPTLMQRDFSSTSSSSQSMHFHLHSPRVSSVPADQLPANRILVKLDSVLGTSSTNSASAETSMLDAPPRKLLLNTSALQVVNANTVKDRYLFLFTDLLIIAKPLILAHPLTGEPIPPTLDNQFLVKSVVDLKDLKLSAAESAAEETGGSSSGGSSKKRHPLLLAFVDRFANEPSRAIASLVQKGGLTNDGPTISNLLFKNTDLNRNQLGAYLASPNHRHVLRSYIERFRFGGVRIDDALRLFLMSVRLPPQDRKAAEYVLGVLANIWAETNVSSGLDPSLAFSLMVSILRLSDALHSNDERDSSEGPILPSSRGTQSFSVDEFIRRFREHDIRMVVPEDLLARIYTSIRRERIEQASDNSIFSMTPDIEATIEPAKLPTHLTYRTPSEVFTISVPAPDTKFSIKLAGPDLEFDPPVLSFARSATQSFRVTGTALGVRVMVLIKRGANAPRYQGLPLNKAFSVERAFMQNTFQVSFTNHLDVKRKYMFSVSDSTIRSEWLSTCRAQISDCHKDRAPSSPALAAANAVSTQVLRDVFLPPEEPIQVPSAAPSPRPNLATPRFGAPVTASPRARLGTPTRTGRGFARSNSISKLYASQFKQEADLSERKQSLINGQLRPSGTGAGSGRDDVAILGGSEFAKTGHEVVTTTEQNSLLPMVLSFLNSGLEAAPHPLSLQGSAFQLPPLPPSSGSVAPSSAFPLVGFPFLR